MSYLCDICGKSNMRGNLVSHSKQRMHRRYLANLHHAKALVNGVVKKLLVCTKCLRRLKRPDRKIEKLENVKLVKSKEAVKQVVEKAVVSKTIKPADAKAMAGKEVKVKETTIEELMKESASAKASK